MIKRLVLKDYMAHKETNLELGPGVTVLTGPNNSGKSAVVEAIRSLAQNPPPQHLIRHGASQAVVQVELDSGEVIEWVRSKGSSVYHLYRPESDVPDKERAKETYAKFGRVPPEDISGLLRLNLVETETEPVDIHIGNQRAPIFLLDQTGSQAASFFAASTEAEYLLRMQQALKTRTDRAKSKRKELLKESEELEKALGLFLPLDDVEEALGEIEKSYLALNELRLFLPSLEAFIQIIEATGTDRAAKAASCKALEDLKNPPELHETAALEEALEEIRMSGSALSLLANSVETLAPLVQPPALVGTDGIEALIDSLGATDRALHRGSLAIESLDVLVPPPSLDETAGLERALQDIERGKQAFQRSVAAHLVLGWTKAPPEIPETEVLRGLIAQMSRAMTESNRCGLRGAQLESLQPPGELHVLEPLNALIGSLKATEARMGVVGNSSAFLAQLSPCSELSPVTPLEELIGQMSRLQGAAAEVDRQADEVACAVAGKRTEVEEAIRAAGICPLCGHTLDVEHFMEGIHG